MPKASRQKPTTQHTKDTSFFTCHLITGDISRARTAETYPQLHSYLRQKSGQAVGSFVPGESGRETQEEWACAVWNYLQRKRESAAKSQERGREIREKQNLLSESCFRPED